MPVCQCVVCQRLFAEDFVKKKMFLRERERVRERVEGEREKIF
jgi:hypothetical protein